MPAAGAAPAACLADAVRHLQALGLADAALQRLIERVDALTVAPAG